MFRKLAFTLAAAAAALIASTTATFAGQKSPDRPVSSSSGGVAVSLTTSGYVFGAPTETDRDLRSGKPLSRSFAATAILQNRGRGNVTFQFPDSLAAAVKWKFRVFDSNGTPVWESDADMAGATVITPQTLARGQRWKRDIRVPLAIGETPLAPGIYTLEASIDADKTLGATAIFEIVSKDTPQIPGGIRGLVTRTIRALDDGDARMQVPAVGAVVTVVEAPILDHPTVRAPFVWTGQTDESGRFELQARPGRYRVTASIPRLMQPTVRPIVWDELIFEPKTVEVTVTANAYSEVTIDLVARTQPSTKQGISGAVYRERGEGGVEVPVAGATVTIFSLPTVTTDFAPTFHWTGRANEAGKFLAQTPPGRYRVSAREGGIIFDAPTVGLPAASVDVQVDEGTITEVVLRLPGVVTR